MTDAQHAATTPTPGDGEDWFQRVAEIDADVRQHPDTQLLFVGDSITDAWRIEGAEVWREYYAHRNALNAGIGGDRTQHVLWRIDHGQFDGLSPRLIVLLIGTNNSNDDDHTANEIADGITAIVARLRAIMPDSHILLLAILPREPSPCPQRDKIAQANRLAARLADARIVHYLDIGRHFLTPTGSPPASVMPDYLHLSPKGYRIWATAMESTLARLLRNEM